MHKLLYFISLYFIVILILGFQIVNVSCEILFPVSKGGVQNIGYKRNGGLIVLRAMV